MLDIQKAVQILKKGGLVGMPTETVYGLAADARNPLALTKIFIAKQRPVDHPLIVHIADLSHLSQWAVNIPDVAYSLAKAFWPGPLTFILPKNPDVSEIVTGGQNSIGIRMPSHPIALELIRKFGSGLAAPSANRFGRISPTTAKAVWEELGSSVDLILDGGACDVGVESTIIDLRAGFSSILRPGMINSAQIAAVIGTTVIPPTPKPAVRVSGAMASHYAPVTPTRMLTHSQLEFFLKNRNKSQKVGLLQSRSLLIDYPNLVRIKMPDTANEYAHQLYANLRELDRQNLQEIIIEDVPTMQEWAAINDRIQRAVFKEKS